MKKEYKTPVSEKIEFDYTDTVVASGGNSEKGQNEYKCVDKPSPCGAGVNDTVRCW